MTVSKKAIVLGGQTGLLGQALTIKLANNGWIVFSPKRSELALFSELELSDYLDNCQPDVVFNAIAYTAVDKAEEEPDEAALVNDEFCGVLASVLKRRSCRCVSISTDFVFDGNDVQPYSENQLAIPKSVYGRTKLAGEKRLLAEIPDRVIIGRTAWLFGPHKANFVSKILARAHEVSELKIVADQIGCPTFTPDLATMCVRLAECSETGIFHLVNSGHASWFEFARTAIDMYGIQCVVTPIASHEFPQLAMRPANSVLNNKKYVETTGDTPRHWQNALIEYIKMLKLVSG